MHKVFSLKKAQIAKKQIEKPQCKGETVRIHRVSENKLPGFSTHNSSQFLTIYLFLSKTDQG
jgi:hypothetical protein